MKTTLHSSRLALPALLAALVITAAPAARAADGWQWLPALNDPAWKPDATLALTGSRIDPDPGRGVNAWAWSWRCSAAWCRRPTAACAPT